MNDDLDPLTLTVEEAAALLGVSRSTAYDLAARGELPTLRVRRRILVLAAPFAEMLGLRAFDLSRARRRRRDPVAPPVAPEPRSRPRVDAPPVPATQPTLF